MIYKFKPVGLLHIQKGWGDSGQHFTISRGGYILEGRYGSLASLDVARIDGRFVAGLRLPWQVMD